MNNTKNQIIGVLLAILIASSAVSAQQVTVTGSLTRTVEAGGWLIAVQSEKYLILNSSRYAGESWFRAGTKVTATGEIKRDVVTIYQEGIPFEAATMAPAQDQNSARWVTLVTVTGDSRISVEPDTTMVTISVVTQNPSAIEAQQINATRTAAVIAAVKATAGPGAEIKTSGYSLTPQRVYKQNEPPTITGYEARNSVLVTLGDLTRIGRVIDAASKAGANNIDGVGFMLRQDMESRGRALGESTRAAIAKATILARTIGGRLGRIVSISEAGTMPRPVMYAQQESFARAAAVETPIEPGTLEIISNIQLTAEIEMP